MRISIRLLPTCLFLLVSSEPVGPTRAADYAWPLKRFAGCTSLFGDYRPGRYHAGLDLRTDGEEGWPVLAVADGYVSHVTTSYFGYGRALYLQLDDGRVAVYGHLQDFGPQVNERVHAEQRRLERYRTNLYFGKNELRVRAGMIIARSGQTGAGAPHLHFEIRTGANQPLNPEWQGFPVPDRRDPEIVRLWLVPQYEGGRMGFGPRGPDPAKLALSGGPLAPLELAAGTLFAAGPVGFAVEAYDRKPNSDERHNVAGLSLVVGHDTLFRARYDTLDYETMDQVKLERLLWLNSDGDIYALYKSHGNEMTHSRVHPDHPLGTCVVNAGDTALPFEIVVTDENANRRTLRGRLAYREPESLFVEPAVDPVVISAHALDIRPDRARGLAADLEARGLTGDLLPISKSPAPVFRLQASDLHDSIVWPEGTEPLLSQTTVLVLTPDREHDVWLPDSSLEIRVPKGAVYEPAFLVLQRGQSPKGEPMFSLGPDDLVLRTALQLSFRAPAEDRQALFTQNGTGAQLGFVEHRRKEGRIECRSGGPARYTFATDSLPPVIRRLRPTEDAVVGRRPVIMAHLEDDLSGVGDDSLIVVRVDGKWALPEYDPESNQLVARPFEALTPGQHRLELEVSDWAGNVRRISRSFNVK